MSIDPIQDEIHNQHLQTCLAEWPLPWTGLANSETEYSSPGLAAILGEHSQPTESISTPISQHGKDSVIT